MKALDSMRAWLGLILGLLGTVVIATVTILLGGVYGLVIDWWLPLSNPFRYAPRVWGSYGRYVIFGWIMGGSVQEHSKLPVLPKGKLIPMVINHFTNVETVLLVWYIYSRLKVRTMVILKKEYKRRPMGWWTLAVKAAIFVDRGDPEASRAAIAHAIAKARKLGERLVIVSFPDGTRPTREKIDSGSKRLKLRYLTEPKGGGVIKTIRDVSTNGAPVIAIHTRAFSIPREPTFARDSTLRGVIASLMHTGLVYHIESGTCEFTSGDDTGTYEILNRLWKETDDMIVQLTDV